MMLATLLSLLLYSCQPASQSNQTTVPVLPPPVAEKVIAQDTTGNTVEARLLPPADYIREKVAPGSFATFLRQLPLKPIGSSVYHYDKTPKYRQDVHAAVIDLDVGNRDLQQCADAVMRLRAEYLWHKEAYHEISFQFTNGFPAPYSRWRAGERIRVAGNEVSWVRSGQADASYRQFRKYLNMVFAYAGTLSLAKELNRRPIEEIAIGDVFIQGGSPGHAVIVVDLVRNETDRSVMVLLAQSYMPAQDLHVLKNFQRTDSWYPIDKDTGTIRTPEWTFDLEDLKHF